MADKNLQVRIKQKYDTLANWQKIWATFVPLKGEICVFEVPSTSVPVDGSVAVPQHITKTGDGTTTLQALPWDSAIAADVYAWAKTATKPTYTKSEVGLGNVTNESKATMFTSAALTGTPTAPTAAAGTNSTQIATTAFVKNAVDNAAANTTVAKATYAESAGSATTATTATTANKVSNSIVIKGNGTSVESFNGSAASEVNFVPGANVSVTAADGKITIAATDTTYSDATTSKAGLMTAAMVSKLNGIAEGANNYSLPNAGASLGGVKSGGVATISGGVITAISSVSSAANADHATTADSATTAGSATTATTATTANKVANKLTVGSKTYDGSAAITINASDLGLSNALHFIGAKDSLPSTGSNGDVVLVGSKEYVYSDGWKELGDGDSHALKTVTVTAGDGLTGGGTLASNFTISHADTSSASSVTASGRKYITGVTLDTYGHVTGLTTGTETVTDTNTTYDLAASASSTNGNVKINLTAGGSGSGIDSITIKGTGATSVTTDSSGVITIDSINTTYSDATTSASGLMTAAMVTKLNGIATGATANTGTITEIKANGTSVATSGSANIPAASTSVYGVTKLSSATNSTSTSLAATASAVKAAYDLAASKASTDVATTSANGLMSSAMVTKLNGIAEGANNYSHPTHTAKSNGFYKVTVDSLGHVTGTAAVAKSDITALGIPASNTTYTAASGGGLKLSGTEFSLDDSLTLILEGGSSSVNI